MISGVRKDNGIVLLPSFDCQQQEEAWLWVKDVAKSLSIVTDQKLVHCWG